MDERMNTNPEELLVAERAAEWLERLKEAGPYERAEFNRWLRESPRHVREILLATTWDSALGNMDPDRRIDVERLIAEASVNVVPVRSSHSQTVHGRGVPSWPWTVSLGFGCAALAAAVILWSGSLSGVLHPGRYTTSTGEQRAIQLEDGSVVSLNTQSNVQVDLSDETRDVYLNAGQALFAVAHDADRPFRVHVGEAAVEAIGTKFDVYRRTDRTDVAVIEGRVQIDTEAPRASKPKDVQLGIGEMSSIAADGQVTEPRKVNVADVSAWQQRRLVFRSNTLAEMAAEFARYNRTPQILIEGEKLRARRFSGVFDADDPESLVSFLASEKNIAIERQGDKFIVRLREDVAETL